MELGSGNLDFGFGFPFHDLISRFGFPTHVMMWLPKFRKKKLANEERGLGLLETWREIILQKRTWEANKARSMRLPSISLRQGKCSKAETLHPNVRDLSLKSSVRDSL